MENGDDKRAEQYDKVAVNNLLFKLIPQDNREGNGDEDLRVISVINGEEVTGKTALVRRVYGSINVKRWFPYRAWVRVDDDKYSLTVGNVLVNIMKQISTRDLKDVDLLDEEEWSWRLHLFDCLCKQRYLIVIDNMNSVDLMVKLLTFLVDSSNGSRVIITTCNVNLPRHVDPWVEPVKFHPLSEEDRKQLLLLPPWSSKERDLGLGGKQVRPPLIMQRILSWCSLSPAGIRLLGGLLSVTQDSQRLEAMIGRLAENPSIVDIVSLCYDELSHSLQHCIMYVCQFPRDYEIPTRRLLRLWLAESFLPASESGIQDAEKCFQELVRRNMIHVVSQGKGRVFAKTCRMPGFIHDFLLQKALKMGFFETYSNDSSINIPSGEPRFVAPRIVVDKHKARIIHRLGRSSETQEQYYPTHYNAKQVRSFMSFNTKKIRTKNRELDIFLNPKINKKEKCSSLEVLDLEGVYKPVLPKNLGYVLLNLKYLGLRWTNLHELPKSVSNLPQLETLDIKHTNIAEVPSSIWTKESLRHLYLNEVSFDKSIPHRRRLSQCCSKLPNSLQTLCGLHIEGGNSPMLDVLSKLTGITKLSLTCPSTLATQVIKYMSRMTTLQSLRLKSKDMLGQPSELRLQGMDQLTSLSNLYLFGGLRPRDLVLLPKNLESLTLSMSFLSLHPLNHLGTLQQLTDLRLYGHSYDGNRLKFSDQMFPKLRTLKIWKLDELEFLTVEEKAGPCLEELDIRDCHKLKEIHILGNRKALKEISLAKIKEELAKSLEESLGQPVIVTSDLIPSLRHNTTTTY